MAKIFWKLRLEFFTEDEIDQSEVQTKNIKFEELSEIDQEHILECVKDECYGGVLFSSLVDNKEGVKK